MNVLDIVNGVSGPVADQSVRRSIEAMEAESRKHPQVDIPVIHRYSGGIYAREIIIPKNVLLTGRIYKDDHFDVMVYGDITVSSDDGVKRLTGFNVFKGAQGKKRAGYAHEETKWITFCASEEMDDEAYIDVLSSESFAEFDQILLDRQSDGYLEESIIKSAFYSQPSYRQSDYEAFRSGFIAASGKPSKLDADRVDYAECIAKYGFTEETVREQSENPADQIALDGYNVQIKPSLIEGAGLFAEGSFLAGEVIMPARVGGMRTQAGRYTNHSIIPNAIMAMDGDLINLVAIRTIENEEITIDYEQALILQIQKVA